MRSGVGRGDAPHLAVAPRGRTRDWTWECEHRRVYATLPLAIAFGVGFARVCNSGTSRWPLPPKSLATCRRAASRGRLPRRSSPESSTCRTTPGASLRYRRGPRRRRSRWLARRGKGKRAEEGGAPASRRRRRRSPRRYGGALQQRRGVAMQYTSTIFAHLLSNRHAPRLTPHPTLRRTPCRTRPPNTGPNATR